MLMVYDYYKNGTVVIKLIFNDLMFVVIDGCLYSNVVFTLIIFVYYYIKSINLIYKFI